MARRDSTTRSDIKFEVSEYGDNKPKNASEAEVERPGGSSQSAGAMRGITVFLLFVALVLIAFAASSPVTQSFYLFSLKISADAVVDKIQDEFRFGVWTYCSTGVENSFGELSFDNLSISNSPSTSAGCHNRKLGWTFKDIPGIPDEIQNTISGALTGAFVLHIVAAVTIFPAMCIAVVAAKRDKKGDPDAASKRRRISSMVFVLACISMFFTSLVLVLDGVGIGVTKHKVHDKSNGAARLEFGSAFWCVCAAAELVLLALIIATLDCISAKKTSPRDDSGDGSGSSKSQTASENKYEDVPMTPLDSRRQY